LSRSLSQLTLLGVFGAIATGCLTAPEGKDIEEIASRYEFRMEGECSSWLRSFQTGFEYCASPPFTVHTEIVDSAPPAAEPALAAEGGGDDKDSLMAHGEQVYGRSCTACHQASGEGLAGMFPPLAGAGEFYGDAQSMAGIIANGISGEITVLGTTYNGSMPPGGGATLSDYDVAAVATYVRHSWGNDDGIVVPEDVAAVRE